MSITNCHCGSCRGVGTCCIKYAEGGGFNDGDFSKLGQSTLQTNSWFLDTDGSGANGPPVVSSLPSSLFVGIDATNPITRVQLSAIADPSGNANIRIRFNNSTDRDQFVTNLNNYTDKTFALVIKVTELYTDSDQPAAPYNQTDSFNNKIITQTSVNEILEYHWSVEDIVNTNWSNNTSYVQFNLNSTGGSTPFLQASTHARTTRRCINPTTECLNGLVCTWGKDPEFLLSLVGVAGQATDDFINRQGSICAPNESGCGPVSNQCCTSEVSGSWCVANMPGYIQGIPSQDDCCCCKYLSQSGQTACCEECDYRCSTCQCCAGVGGDIDEGGACEPCTDPQFCFDFIPIGSSQCICEGALCNESLGSPFCVEGRWAFPQCGPDECETPITFPTSDSTYTCLISSPEFCKLKNEEAGVEWACWSGKQNCDYKLPPAVVELTDSCPCLDEIVPPITTDDCGCTRDGNGNFVYQCNTVGNSCTQSWSLGTSCTGNNVFSLDFTDSSGAVSDQLQLFTQVPYFNQIKPTKCGCDTSCPDASINLSLGHLDPCFDSFPGSESCCPNWCDGLCPVYQNISYKKIHHCNISTTVTDCSTCGGSASPVLMESAPLKLTLDFNANNGIELQRDNGWNDFVAVSPNNEQLITTNNNNYEIPSDGVNNTWETIFDVSSLFTSDYLLSSLLFTNTNEQNFVLNDFSNLSSFWRMETHCTSSLRYGIFNDLPGDVDPETSTVKNIYNQLIVPSNTWVHEGPSSNENNTVWLRLYTTNLRGLYKTPINPDCSGDSTVNQYRYQIDHVYQGNSQYERGYDSNDCITKEGTDCTETQTCVYCNPWETINKAAVGTDSYRCTSYIDGSGNPVTPTEGSKQFPIKPYEYRYELWFAGEAASNCRDDGNDEDYTPNFKLAAIVREVADCSSCSISGYNTGNENQYQTYNDTCSSHYWQCNPRTTKLVAYGLVDDGTSEPWNQTLTANYENEEGEIVYIEPGIESQTTPRIISLTPKSSGAMNRSTTGDVTQDATTVLTPASSVAWNEDIWYHADPKHSFEEVGKGKPQVMARWTELPFKNYARDYLDESKTLKGFYLTLSAYHLDGISNIGYYLDGAKTGNGTAFVSDTTEHPLEPTKAQIVKDDDGTLLSSLKEYTVAVDTTSITTGVHEVRAKINPKNHQYGNRGTARFLYGEPPTGDASVNTADFLNPAKGTNSYSVISGQTWPVSQAKWPANIPDGPSIYDTNKNSSFSNKMFGIDRSENNLNPMWGAENFWNLHNKGFQYYANATDATNKTQTLSSENNFIFGGTPQQELLLNGYESFWFNFNPTPLTVYVGQAGDSVPEDSSYFATSLYEAFQWLENNYTADNASLHDAEIVLISGTSASPRKYSWPNTFVGESLPSSVSWCQNALQKKSFVIRSENPDDKEGTILWFPPAVDRVEIPWNNFALHVRDLTVYTSSQRGLSDKSCFHSNGTNCRLIVENCVFASTCSTGIKSSALVDSSGDVICGDTLQRAANGSVTGQIDYSKCRNINTTTSNLECAKTTADCASITCCGAKVTGGCQACTGATCTRCRKNCTCRSTEIDWWPFFSSDSFDMDSSGTSLEPVILCGNNDCTSGASWACKGIFGSDIVTSSPFMCLGTQPQHCVMLGLFNHELMDMAHSTEWKLGMYGKDIEVRDVPGTSLKNPVLMKHILVDNYNKNLISDKGHGAIIDLWIKNADPLTTSFVPDMDIIKWEAIGYDTYSLETVKDYDQNFASSNPRSVRNFNCFIENRMMVNIKVDNCHARVINMAGPALRYRDFLANPTATISSYSGHHNNFGMPSTRNFVFKDFHIEDKKASDQVFGNFPINHLYMDNFVVSNHLKRNCDSTAATTDTCSYAEDGALFPLSNVSISTANAAYLHYGKKPIQNLRLTNSLFQNLGTGKYSWNDTGALAAFSSSADAKFQNDIDWGSYKRKAGNNFMVQSPNSALIKYFWNGTFEPIISNVRQQRLDRENCTLLPFGATSGLVVHKSISPPIGSTACGSACDYGTTVDNHFSIDSTSLDWLANTSDATSKQKTIFGIDSTSKRITSNKPKFSKTLITGKTRKTADNKDACYDITHGTCSGESDPFQFPSEAHSNLIAYAEGLSSGNLFSRGIPNVGGMQLQWAIPKNYYHDVCTFASVAQTCRRNPILDGRYTNENLTAITESSGTYSWTTNALAECAGNCKIIRDHYFIDNTNTDNRIDLDWIPVIDECRCSDV